MVDNQEDIFEFGAAPSPSASTANCSEAVRQLYDFIDGELTDCRRQAIAMHLDRCGDCVDAFDFEAELRKVVADRCRDRVPEYLRNRIATAINQERELNGHLDIGGSRDGISAIKLESEQDS